MFHTKQMHYPLYCVPVSMQHVSSMLTACSMLEFYFLPYCVRTVHKQHAYSTFNFVPLWVFPNKMASSSTGQDSVSLSDLRDKYTEYSRLIDIENSKIKRDSPRELRQAILENILNLKREQVDIQLRINQLKKK